MTTGSYPNSPSLLVGRYLALYSGHRRFVATPESFCNPFPHLDELLSHSYGSTRKDKGQKNSVGGPPGSLTQVLWLALLCTYVHTLSPGPRIGSQRGRDATQAWHTLWGHSVGAASKGDDWPDWPCACQLRFRVR